MDGRVQDCVNRWMKNLYRADSVEVITAPGPVWILASGEPEFMAASIQRCLTTSVEKHRSPAVAIVAPHDCAGNPLPRESQIEQLLQTSERLRNLFPGLDFRLLWVDENWEAQEIKAQV